MSGKTKTFGLGFGFILIGFIWVFFIAYGDTPLEANPPVREIRLVAEGMSFRIQDVNPPVVLYKGERVRFVITNDDPGIVHGLTIKGLNFRSSRLLDYGESDVITFDLPEDGPLAYFCPEHPEMMTGEIIIEEDPLVQVN